MLGADVVVVVVVVVVVAVVVVVFSSYLIMAAPIGTASEPGRKPKVSIFALTTSVTRTL